ncbi:hypothetical protein [Staphylococcus aureus]|uniref:hypothetical protein n=1 Tax=Staphylococcus aureus TaxID=1280 RepID=UPI00227172BB|nr:hypothetical protein [Staphylococcus aureus]
MDFVAIDVETANEQRSSICSIALLKFQDNKMRDAIYTHINPETYFFFYKHFYTWNIRRRRNGFP